MDLDPCSDSNFNDGMPPFIPNESLNGFLSFTDDELDTAIASFAAPHPFGGFGIDSILEDELTPPPSLYDTSPNQNYDFKLDLWPPTSAFAPSTPPSSSSSSSSPPHCAADLQFDPDVLMSFLNEDDCKLGELTQENITNMPQRNTPSPTGSYISSSGSSTSGVHSCASSSAFTDSYAESKSAMLCKEESQDCPTVEDAPQWQFVAPAPKATPLVSDAPAFIPATQTAPTILQPTHVEDNDTPMPAALTLDAVASVGAGPMPAVAAPDTTAEATTIKIEPSPMKLAESPPAGKPTVKIVTSTANGQQTTGPTVTKVAAPTNSKPKTIFLSSNDFKTLMQKMNSNGAKGAKISGGLNAQMPKIIMKTANGKVVTANKPTILNVSNANAATAVAGGGGTAAPVAHKFVKAPLVVKQQHHHQAQHHQTTRVLTGSGLSGPSRASLSSSGSGGPDMSIYRGFIDEKMYKKHQRMIKNRESASLSRKKKKEYVVSLETRINDLEKENCTLKGENTSLRSQLVAYAQSCHCKHTNVSEFILNSLNIKVNNNGLAVAGGNISSEQHHVKIAPKPIGGKSIKSRMSATTVKKNMAVLFAMAFMVTLNVGSFQTYFNKNSLENAMETVTIEETAPPLATANANGRRLLWVESETEFNEKLNRSKREAELEVPPLHFLRPVNRTGANALAAAEQHGKRSDPSAAAATKCDDVPLATNQTEENMRMAKKLHKWIDGNDYLNLSLHEKFDGNDLNNPGGFKLTPDYLKLKPIDLPVQQGQKRKYYLQRATDFDNNNDNANNKQRKFEGKRNSLDLFKPKISEEYLRLFKGIKRQDDTFYVLSFNMDHILLPASAYNKSSRPKMSLMLPAGDPSLNGDIVLMQIDCEVVNTTELVLKSHMIPDKLKPNKYAGNVHVHPHDMANNETRGASAHGKQQQRQQQAHRTQAMEREKKVPMRAGAVGGRGDVAAASEQFKDKPPIRTYFMMGPRTQAALKNRTKLNAIRLDEHTEAVYSTGVANTIDLDEEQPKRMRFDMRNSSLFSRMRETIEGDNSKPEDF